MFVSALRRAVGSAKVVTDPAIMSSYSRDQASLVAYGVPAAVLRAESTADVVAGINCAAEYGRTVVPRGAGTGLSGGANATDGCLVVSLAKMTGIRRLDLANRTVEVEAGVVNADLGRAVQGHGLFYPPDPGSFEVSTIGGNLATNAGGMRCVKYGVTRTSTLGVEVVLADGQVLHTGARTAKNVAGLDLTSLFVGSEGTLGIITAATLQLRRSPPHSPATFVAAFDSLADAGTAINRIWDSETQPSVLELMDQETIQAIERFRTMGLDLSWKALLIGQSDSSDHLEQVDRMAQLAKGAGATFCAVTEDGEEGEQFIRTRRLAGTATTETGPTIIEDVVVPPSNLAEMFARIQQLSQTSNLRIATVAHAGDGNLHPVIMLPDLTPETLARAHSVAEQMALAAIDLGGSITGEHGVGVLKRAWARTQLGETSVVVQGRIKAALDPDNRMNPYRAF
jgi:glycolate oxidase